MSNRPWRARNVPQNRACPASTGPRAWPPVTKKQPLGARRDATWSLAQYCPDLDDWPGSWQIERGDATIGRRIVAAFRPFLLELLHQGFTRKTLVRHRDNLWLLGGEVIERRHRDGEPDQRPVKEVLLDLVYDDGGLLLWPRLSEAQQKSCHLQEVLSFPSASGVRCQALSRKS